MPKILEHHVAFTVVELTVGLSVSLLAVSLAFKFFAQSSQISAVMLHKTMAKTTNKQLLKLVARDFSFKNEVEILEQGRAFRINRKGLYRPGESYSNYSVTYRSTCINPENGNSKVVKILKKAFDGRNSNVFRSSDIRCLHGLGCPEQKVPQITVSIERGSAVVPNYARRLFPSLIAGNRESIGSAICVRTKNSSQLVTVESLFVKHFKKATLGVVRDEITLTNSGFQNITILPSH